MDAILGGSIVPGPLLFCQSLLSPFIFYIPCSSRSFIFLISTPSTPVPFHFYCNPFSLPQIPPPIFPPIPSYPLQSIPFLFHIPWPSRPPPDPSHPYYIHRLPVLPSHPYSISEYSIIYPLSIPLAFLFQIPFDTFGGKFL